MVDRQPIMTKSSMGGARDERTLCRHCGLDVLIRVRLGLDAAARWWDQVEASTRLSWQSIDTSRAEKARIWFFRWRDKEFSFTDCTSFVVMRQLRLRRALTTDRHFRDAGFEIVP